MTYEDDIIHYTEVAFFIAEKMEREKDIKHL